jgi:hypothetical protein
MICIALIIQGGWMKPYDFYQLTNDKKRSLLRTWFSHGRLAEL